MNTTTVLLVCLLASVPVAHGFYLFFPQANDRILALEAADRVPSFDPESILVDPEQEEEEEEAAAMAKRTSVNRGSLMRRRSADGYHCPCLHKVCTFHCMTK